MKPAYFPFSHISASTAEQITKIFGETIVYMPIRQVYSFADQDIEKKGMIEFRFPLKPYEEKIGAAFREYGEWVKLNRGTRGIGAQFFRNREEPIPFFDETSISRIRNDIKARSKGIEKNETEEILFGAGLFSAVAKEMDSGNEDLERDLEKFNRLEENFLDDLNVDGKPEFLSGRSSVFFKNPDRGSHMIPERVRAWCTMMMEDEKTPDYFVTTSRAVVQYLMELDAPGIADLKEIARPENGEDEPGNSKLHPDLNEMVERLVKAKDLSHEIADARVDISGNFKEMRCGMTFFVVPGMTPASYIDSLITIRNYGEKRNMSSRIKNTVICLLDV